MSYVHLNCCTSKHAETNTVVIFTVGVALVVCSYSHTACYSRISSFVALHRSGKSSSFGSYYCSSLVYRRSRRLVSFSVPFPQRILKFTLTSFLGVVYITFDQTFPFGTSDVEFTVDALGTGVSATFDNVLLAEGVATLLTLLPSSTIDLISVTL